MNYTLTLKHAFFLYSAAFITRALVMIFLIQPNEYYKQADSTDYHNCAITMAIGNGMNRPDTHEPIFWRTPGYPSYLAAFYTYYGVNSADFSRNAPAQLASIWVQIALTSLIPLIAFSLAMTLTHIPLIAYALAAITIIHPGLVLASSYLLTEGLALIFFYLFLLFFYRIICTKTTPWKNILLAVINLSLYTWMRPMGEFLALFCAIIILFFAHFPFKKRAMLALTFAALFFATLSPWYLRNHRLTDEWFFCPTIGTYLNVFSAPKIVRRTTGKSLIECHKLLQHNAAIETLKRKNELQGTGKFVSHNICKKTCYPIIAQHPFYFMYDWIAEVIKTTLDLYSYQLIPMLDDSYWYDPIEEYLPEKITACLYNHAMPIHYRLVCWLEFITNIILWIGLFGGLWVFVINPIVRRKTVTPFQRAMQPIWLISIALIGIIVGMTGGFGYARLRLPAEPLIIILSLTFWYWISQKSKNLI